MKNSFLSWVVAGGAMLLLLAGIGFLLPAGQMVRRSAVLDRPPTEVWAVVSDVEAHGTWRRDVDRVFALPDRNGHVAWRAVSERGETTFEVVSDTPRRLVLAVSDEDAWFRGTLTWELHENGVGGADGTRVELVESGEVSNVLMRFATRTFLDRGAGLEELLQDLAGAVGEDPASLEVLRPGSEPR